MSACKDCGRPVDHTETHHVDEQRGNNDPDNLSERCRRCHMTHHENGRAIDNRSSERFGPRRPATGPPSP